MVEPETITSPRPGLELGAPKFAISPPDLVAAMEGQQTLLDTRRVRLANALQNRLTEAWVEGADAVEGVHLVLVGSNTAAQADLATSLMELLDPGSIEPREQEAIEAALQEAIETVQNGEGEPERVDPSPTMSVEIYRADADRIEEVSGVLADIFADAVGSEDPVVLVIRPTASEALRLTRAEYLASLGRSMERVNGDPSNGNRYRAADDWSGRFVIEFERGAILTEVAIQLPVDDAPLADSAAQAHDLVAVVEPLLSRFLTSSEQTAFVNQFFDQSLMSFESFGVRLRLVTHPDGSLWRVISAA